jgi:putative transposase
VRTTVPDPAEQTVPDLLGRDFTAEEPNQRYVGDITYLPIADGTNLYLATVIDCHSRRLTGWAIAEHMRTDLIINALSAARDTRGSLAGAIFHSDHGVRAVTALRFTQRLVDAGVAPSTGSTGDSFDNALAENLWSTIKVELMYWPGTTFATRSEAEHALIRYIGWYNPRRIQAGLGGLSPDEYEETYHRAERDHHR